MARIDIPMGDGEDRQRMWRLRPEIGEAAERFSEIIQESSIIPVREHEAARIRIAHINECEPCSQTRMEDMGRYELDESFYENVDDPSLRGQYTVRERLAIEFAERFAEGQSAFDDDFWSRMRLVYTDAEIVDLAASCAKWLGLGRINSVLGLTVSCPIRL